MLAPSIQDFRMDKSGKLLPTTALILAMYVCDLGVRVLMIPVFCFSVLFCGRGRPQDIVERVEFEFVCRNQGSLPSGIGSKATFFWGGGTAPRILPVSYETWSLCSPAVPEIKKTSSSSLPVLREYFPGQLYPSLQLSTRRCTRACASSL